MNGIEVKDIEAEIELVYKVLEGKSELLEQDVLMTKREKSFQHIVQEAELPSLQSKTAALPPRVGRPTTLQAGDGPVKQ